MKNTFTNYCLLVCYFLSTVALFAQPGGNDPGGVLEEPDPLPVEPIGDYVWFLVIVGFVFAYYKFKNLNKISAEG
jgi:hypothetical protein